MVEFDTIMHMMLNIINGVWMCCRPGVVVA